MTGWLGVAEGFFAIIGATSCAVLIAGVGALWIASRPVPDTSIRHALEIANERRHNVAAVNWTAVRAEVETWTAADFNHPGGKK